MSASQLLQSNIFLYSHSYEIPTSSEGYGKLQALETPSLHSLEWPMPDDWSLISFKRHIISKIQSSLKFGKASKSVGLSWDCPIHVFVHLFRSLPLTLTPTKFVCKDTRIQDLDTILGQGWGFVDGVHDGDRYQCYVGSTGVNLQYLKNRATLCMRYSYERWMYKKGKWLPLQVTFGDIEVFNVVINMPRDAQNVVQVNKNWTLANIREHFMAMGMEDISTLAFRLNKRKVGS